MAAKTSQQRTCAVCGKAFSNNMLVPSADVRDVIANEIKSDVSQWSAESFICRTDLNHYRTQYVRSLLKAEKGELTSLEQDVVRSLRDHELMSKNVEDQFDHQWSFGERLADRIAVFGGSWSFLICFAIFLVIWIASNTILWSARPIDPYPFILLNLVLSCLAAIQAPIIMMSQNRQEAKDRRRSQHDYQVNLKAELEIRHLHEKLDHLLLQQWERLAQIQEIQIELMSEIGRKR